MELSYCDNCGAVETTDSAVSRPGAQFLCRACRGESAQAEAPPPSEAGTHGGDQGASSAGLEIINAPPPEAHDLELFSAKSFAMQRKRITTKRPRSGSRRSQPQQTREGEAEDQESFTLPANESLDLFSADTVAFKKKQLFGQSSRGERSSRPGSSAARRTAREGSAQVGEREGSARTRTGSTRLQFRCAHCRSKLVVRPITKVSKIVCPRCSQKTYVDASGKVYKTAPETTSPPDPSSKTFVASIDEPQNELPAPPASLSSSHQAESGASRSSALEHAEAAGRTGGSRTRTLAREHQASRSDEGGPAGATAPRTSETTEGEAFIEDLLSELETEPIPAARPPSTRSSSPEALRQPREKKSAAPPRPFEGQTSDVKSYVTSFLFGLIICSPLLVATLLIHETRRPHEDDSRIAAMLDSVGNAVERAYQEVFLDDSGE